MESKRRHWMTICSLSCFVLAAALMITSLDTSKRAGGLEASSVPIELAFSPRRL